MIKLKDPFDDLPQTHKNRLSELPTRPSAALVKDLKIIASDFEGWTDPNSTIPPEYWVEYYWATYYNIAEEELIKRGYYENNERIRG